MADEFDTEGLEGMVPEDDGQQDRPQGTQPQGPSELNTGNNAVYNTVQYLNTQDVSFSDAAKYATAEFAADGSYRQEEQGGIHDTYKRAERAASWLTLASADIWVKRDSAMLDNYAQSFGGNIKGRMEELGIISHDAESEFIKALNKDNRLEPVGGGYTAVPFSDEELEMAAEFGAFTREVNGDSFNASEWGILNTCYDNVTNEHAINVADTYAKAHDILVSKGISPSELQGNGVQAIIGKLKGDLGTGHGKVKTTIEIGANGQIALGPLIAEKRRNKVLLNPKTDRERSDVMREIRRAETINTAKFVNGFTGSAQEHKEFMVLHKDKEGNTYRTINGVKLKPDIAKKVEEHFAKVGDAIPQDAAAIKSGVLRRSETILMDDTNKRGFGFIRNTVTTTARGASTVYGAYLAVSQHHATVTVHKLDKKLSDINAELSRLGANSGNLSAEIAKAVNGGDLKKAEELKKLKTDFDVAEKQRELNAMLGGKNGEIQTLRNSRKDARTARRTKNGTSRRTKTTKYRADKKAFKEKTTAMKDEIYKAKHGHYSNAKLRRDAKAERLKNKLGKKPGVLGKVRERMANRFTGIRNTWEAIATRLSETKLARAVTGVTHALNELKHKLIVAAGSFLLGYLKFVLAAWVATIPAVLLIFMFLFGANLFGDKTNYAGVLVADMEDLEFYFIQLAKAEAYGQIEQETKKDNNINLNLSNSEEKFYYVPGEPELAGYFGYDKGATANHYYQQGHVTAPPVKTASSMGSYVPYFGALRYRFLGEDFFDDTNGMVDKKMYKTAKTYMYMLWLSNHQTYTENFSNSKKYENHVTKSECDNWHYHNEKKGEASWQDGKPSKNCNKYDTQAIPGTHNCIHTHEDKCYPIGPVCGYEEHTHGETCYEPYLACGYTEHTHNDKCNGNKKKPCKIPEHTHSQDCVSYMLSCTQTEHTHTDSCMGYDTSKPPTECTHVCKFTTVTGTRTEGGMTYPYYVKGGDSCYEVKTTQYLCKGHCSGHIIPRFSIYFMKYFDDIVYNDRYNGPRYVNVSIEEYLPYVKMDGQSWLKKKATGFMTWIKKWTKGEYPAVYKMRQQFTDTTNPESVLSKINAGDSKYLKEWGLNTAVAQLFAVPKAGGGWNAGQKSDAAAMLGDADDGYRDGVNYFAEFGVYFALERDVPLSKEEVEEWLAKAQGTSKKKMTEWHTEMLRAALEECGHWEWDMFMDNGEYDESTKRASNFGFINYLFQKIGLNKATVQGKRTWEAKNLGGLSLYDYDNALIPGSLLVTDAKKENQKCAVFLRAENIKMTVTDKIMGGNEHLTGKVWIIDCSSNPGKSTIRCIGYEELVRVYDEVIPKWY